MPPAFNLSQDQTLQFNLLLLQSRIPSQLLLRSQNTDKVLLSKSLLSLVNVRLPTPQTSTLIICLFLKIVSPISYPSANNKALCLSSTEKRNYFTSLTSCQELFFNTLPLQHLDLSPCALVLAFFCETEKQNYYPLFAFRQALFFLIPNLLLFRSCPHQRPPDRRIPWVWKVQATFWVNVANAWK